MGGAAIKLNRLDVSSHCGFSLLFLLGLEWVVCLHPPGKRADGIQQGSRYYPLSLSIIVLVFRPSVRLATDDRPYARHMTFLMLRHDLRMWSREEDEEETALRFFTREIAPKKRN